jgi:phosphoadenosine phosphosulfate reductase
MSQPTPEPTAALYEGLEPGDVIAKVLSENPGSPCITCSFQIEGVIVLDMLRKLVPKIPVLFLDTGYHFAETYSYRDRLATLWNLNLVNITPAQTVAEQEAQLGVLYQTDPGNCCYRRKVEPLMKALAPFDLWFTGLRREQSPTRRNLRTFEHHKLPTGHELRKISPLASWDSNQVWQYAAANGIERLPLYDLGYLSIGCEPCTSLPAERADARSGRWGGTRLECGIHTFSQRAGSG